MDSKSLFDLPDIVIIQILSNLNIYDLKILKCTCRKAVGLIGNLSNIRYTIIETETPIYEELGIHVTQKSIYLWNKIRLQDGVKEIDRENSWIKIYRTFNLPSLVDMVGIEMNDERLLYCVSIHENQPSLILDLIIPKILVQHPPEVAPQDNYGFDSRGNILYFRQLDKNSRYDLRVLKSNGLIKDKNWDFLNIFPPTNFKKIFQNSVLVSLTGDDRKYVVILAINLRTHKFMSAIKTNCPWSRLINESNFQFGVRESSQNQCIEFFYSLSSSEDNFQVEIYNLNTNMLAKSFIISKLDYNTHCISPFTPKNYLLKDNWNFKISLNQFEEKHFYNKKIVKFDHNGIIFEDYDSKSIKLLKFLNLPKL